MKMNLSKNLSVAILSYNHPELTGTAVHSAQKFFADNHIILIHNGSEEKHIQHLQQRFTDIRHLIIKSNVGYSGGVNQALNAAFDKTNWCLFLTNDCVLTSIPDRLPDDPDLIAPLILIRETNRVDSIGGFLNLKTGKLVHAKNDWASLTASENLKRYVPGTAFLIHKDVFIKVGGFDESLHTYWEDVDFSIKAQKKGFKLSSENKLILKHGVGKTCHKNKFYTTYLFHRNKKIICRRHTSKTQRILFETNYHLSLIKLGLLKVKQRKYKDLKFIYKALID